MENENITLINFPSKPMLSYGTDLNGNYTLKYENTRFGNIIWRSYKTENQWLWFEELL